MDPTYLEQLKQERATIADVLQSQRDNQVQHAGTGIQLTVQMYIQILQDALTTVNSLIEHLEATSKSSSLDRLISN